MIFNGLVHLYIGRGKGKTTAAIGLILRACGAKKKACLIQFLKPVPACEVSVLKRLGVKVVSFKERHPLFYKSASMKALKEKVSKDIEKAQDILESAEYGIVVLDEVLYLLEKNLVKESDILRMIMSKPAQTELVLTGGCASKAISKSADYISTINNTKHPYKSGIPARRSIEF